jgi:hypothetical protein
VSHSRKSHIPSEHRSSPRPTAPHLAYEAALRTLPEVDRDRLLLPPNNLVVELLLLRYSLTSPMESSFECCRTSRPPQNRADPPQTADPVLYEMPNTSPGLCLREVSVPPCVGLSLLPGFSERKPGT